jgi:hypothetical protein
MIVHSATRHGAFQEQQNIRDAWLARYDAATDAEERDCTREGVTCQHSGFRDGAGRTVVETCSTMVRRS